METRLIPLSAVTDLAPLAGLMQDTWPDHYGPGGTGEALADLTARSRATGYPFGIAAYQGDRLLGTGAVTDGTSFGAKTDEGPWLIGLAVAPAVRRQGIGAALVAALEGGARDRGAARIFSTTRTAAGILTRQGWRGLRQVTDDEGTHWQVFCKSL